MGDPLPVKPPTSVSARRNWCRKEIAQWLTSQLNDGKRFVAGIDHGFSFPITYFQRHGITSWQHFLDDFVKHWPAHLDDIEIEALRLQAGGPASYRSGTNSEFRLTERWTSSAKSVFQFDVQGSVAKSTHAGIPWLQKLKHENGDRLHFWPFDGWTFPDEKSVIAEVYPSVFRNRYEREQRFCDQQDAYSVSRWLSESDRHHILARYFDPPLNSEQRALASLEGWILGVF